MKLCADPDLAPAADALAEADARAAAVNRLCGDEVEVCGGVEAALHSFACRLQQGLIAALQPEHCARERSHEVVFNGNEHGVNSVVRRLFIVSTGAVLLSVAPA